MSVLPLPQNAHLSPNRKAMAPSTTYRDANAMSQLLKGRESLVGIKRSKVMSATRALLEEGETDTLKKMKSQMASIEVLKAHQEKVMNKKKLMDQKFSSHAAAVVSSDEEEDEEEEENRIDNALMLPGESSAEDEEAFDDNSTRTLIDYVVSFLDADGYRLTNRYVWKQAQVQGWAYSHVWKQVCAIDEYLMKRISLISTPDAFRCLYQTGNQSRDLQHMSNILGQLEDDRIKRVQKQRAVWAFKNGLYILWLEDPSNKGHAYRDDIHGEYVDLFIPYTALSEKDTVPSFVSASKLFNVDFSTHEYSMYDRNDICSHWVPLATPGQFQVMPRLQVDVRPDGEKQVNDNVQAWLFKDGVYIIQIFDRESGLIYEEQRKFEKEVYRNRFIKYSEPELLPWKMGFPVVACEYFNQCFDPRLLGADELRCTPRYQMKSSDGTYRVECRSDWQDPSVEPELVVLKPCAPVSWWDLPAELFHERIAQHQRWTEEEERMWWVLLGSKLLGNAMDDWEVGMYITARAGSGFSTLIEHIRHIYDKSNVWNIGHDKDPVYNPKKDKLVFKSLKRTQKARDVTFLRMGDSGEVPPETVASLGSKSLILYGELPKRWKQQAGTIYRRMAKFEMTQNITPHEMEAEFGDLLSNELGLHLRKAGLAYLNTVSLIGPDSRSFYKMIPTSLQLE